jgi:hypothetical protein
VKAQQHTGAAINLATAALCAIVDGDADTADAQLKRALYAIADARAALQPAPRAPLPSELKAWEV